MEIKPCCIGFVQTKTEKQLPNTGINSLWRFAVQTDQFHESPNVEVSGLRGFSRRSARLKGYGSWATTGAKASALR